MKLCFGQWGALASGCTCCPEGELCIQDWVLGPLAVLSLGMAEDEGLDVLAAIAGRPLAVVRGAIEHVLEGAPEVPHPMVVEDGQISQAGGLRRCLGTRGEAPAKSVPKPWNNHWRWVRERRRYPQLDRLLPGTVLIRQWAGVEHQAVVLDFGYWYEAKRRPTLYSVMAEIVGRRLYRQPRARGARGMRAVAAWGKTAYQFFGLDRLLGPADRQLVGGCGWKRGLGR